MNNIKLMSLRTLSPRGEGSLPTMIPSSDVSNLTLRSFEKSLSRIACSPFLILLFLQFDVE